MRRSTLAVAVSMLFGASLLTACGDNAGDRARTTQPGAASSSSSGSTTTPSARDRPVGLVLGVRLGQREPQHAALFVLELRRRGAKHAPVVLELLRPPTRRRRTLRPADHLVRAARQAPRPALLPRRRAARPAAPARRLPAVRARTSRPRRSSKSYNVKAVLALPGRTAFYAFVTLTRISPMREMDREHFVARLDGSDASRRAREEDVAGIEGVEGRCRR